MRVRYNASWVTAEIEEGEAPPFSRLVGEMERAMTFKLGERGAVEEDIPVGCPEHPNFNIECPACRRVFRERNRIRPFFLTFPDKTQDFYTLIIPTGLIGYLLEKNFSLPPRYRAALEEVDRRCKAVMEKFKKPAGDIVVLTPNPAHRNAVEEALQHERAIIKGIPGAGKTWVALSIMANISPSARICWLTHTRALLSQTVKRMQEQFKEPIGVIGEGEVNIRERLTVAMFQTIYTRIKENDPAILRFVSNIDVLIIDEMHHIAATTFFTVSQAFKRAYIRYGLSATPFREIKKENYLLIGGLTHEIVTIDVRPTPIHLVLYEMKGSVSVPEFSGMPDAYQRQYEIAVMRNQYRNYIAAQEAIMHAPAVILVQRIEHGERLAALIKQIAKREGKEINVAFMWGAHGAAERQEILDAFESGKVQVLILSDVGREGLSLKNLNCVILAAGQKSKVGLIQRVGRGLHPKGKKFVRVVDFIDAGGIPRRHSFIRIKTLRNYFDIMRVEQKDWRNALNRLLLL